MPSAEYLRRQAREAEPCRPSGQHQQETPIVDDRQQDNEPETRQTELRGDGFVAIRTEKTLDRWE